MQQCRWSYFKLGPPVMTAVECAWTAQRGCMRNVIWLCLEVAVTSLIVTSSCFDVSKQHTYNPRHVELGHFNLYLS